jgi:hypothetical protein
MATRMQQRRGTAATWTSANPILGVGEIGYETDTNKFKIGDGSNRWVNLNYFVDANSILDGAPGVLNTLNELAEALGDDPAFFTTVATNLANHEADATNVHGIANTANLVTLAGTQTLTNKTLTSPSITNPTGIVKADVGLDNVDNISDVNKPVSIAQAAADAVVLASAQTAAEGLVDAATVLSAADATAKANAAQAAAISAAATDATSKANAALASANTYTDGKVADLIDSAPGALDTLNELAAALGDDANFASTITNALALKSPLANPTFTGTVVLPTVSATGDIVPDIDNTYSLGSSTKMWKDLYVGPGSIYVNGQKVLETNNSGDVVVSADLNENLSLRTSGTGNIELNPTGLGSVQIKGPLSISAGKNITSSDGNAIAFSVPINADSISSKSTNTDLTLSGNGTGKVYLNDNAEVSGNFVVGGNLTVSGTTTTVNSETITLADNIIDLNSNFTTGTPTENAGIRVTRGDEANTQLRWNESSDVWQFTNDGSTYDNIVGKTQLDLKAPLASPALTGTPTAPTAALGTNTTQVATTEFVDAAIEALASRSLILDGGGV